MTAGSLAFAGRAEAASSTSAAPTVACWKRLLNDWYDGRIDRAYPLRCYQDAIRNLPEDVKVYADAEADIRRAMLAAVRQSRKETQKEPTQETVLPPVAKPKPPSNPPPPASQPTATTGGKQPQPVDPNNPDDQLVGTEVVATGDPASSDSSVPLPLLVLGALALLLLAAAGAGVVNKRVQARRVPATPPPSEEPPPVA